MTRSSCIPSLSSFSRKKSGFEDIKYFINKYPDLLSFLTAGWRNFKTSLWNTNLRWIQISQWVSGKVPGWKHRKKTRIASFIRMDVIWVYLSSGKLTYGNFIFRSLGKVAKTVPILLHLNAIEESFFNDRRDTPLKIQVWFIWKILPTLGHQQNFPG